MVLIPHTIHVLSSILIQLFLSTVVNANYWPYGNATEYNPSLQSERMKRAPFHRYIPSSILTATIKDGDEEIHLTWKRVERLLFNRNLPVYTARVEPWGPSHKKSNVMRDIGNTITYHDIEHKSTVIYFENMDQLYGVVGRSYEIVRLPLDALSQPLLVGGPHVQKLPYYPHGEKKPKRPNTARCLDFNAKKRKLNSGEASTSIATSDVTVPERFYIEMLLFITYDVTQFFRDKFGETYMQTLLFIYLLHSSAVDMVYAGLPINQFDIYVNLAGIIIEEVDGVFDQIVEYPPLRYDNRPQLQADDSLFHQFDRYSDHFDFPFPRDSYDVIVISTGRELQYGDEKDKGFHLTLDTFEARQHNNQHSYVPMVMLQSRDTYHSYCVLAHKIGKILGIHMNDPSDKDRTVDNIQCYGIMQGSMHHCTACMKWSDESIDQLRIFLSENRNRCWFLNEPRSLLPYGTPIISLSPCRQCTCFGYESYGEEKPNECPWFISAGGCREPLQCRRKLLGGSSEVEPTILPFDGTPCGHQKVCWGEVCTSLQSSIPNRI